MVAPLLLQYSLHLVQAQSGNTRHMDMASGLSGELSCSICLGIYSDPVMLSCGHNFCEICITISWDKQWSTGVYSCPECRAEFKNRPSLQKNLKLGNIVQHYRSTREHAEGTEIFCSYCVTSLAPAVKNCLHCEAALCQLHLKNHSKSSHHILVDPTASLEGQKCPDHDELIRYFCIQDNSFLCSMCSHNEKHKGHKVELVSEAGEKKRQNLWDSVKKLTLHMEETEKLFWKLEKHRKYIKEKSLNIKERVFGLFRGLQEKLNMLEDKTLDEITRQETVAYNSHSQQIQKLDKEMKELHMKKLQIQEICKIPDHLTLLKQPGIHVDPKLGYRPPIYAETLDEEKIVVTLLNALGSLMGFITEIKNKCGFDVEDSTDLILNVNTADPTLALSHDFKEVMDSNRQKLRPHLPERFYTQQVLSTKKFCSGKHYWEVKVFEDGNWSVGVTYNSVKKSGYTSRMGTNEKSWCLSWYDAFDEFYAEYDNEQEEIEDYKFTHKIGIFLDYDDGVVSFYELCDPIQHLYTFHDDFTEPLYAGICVEQLAGIKIC
ncbi:tripartite motif-containing protein 75-like isoform X2 [Hyla sarda]|uniref:tripartite motif-containing protein 75-like isoform X2 n=1 Tax=Hyla sarda TaxID=327740 RepID=UPI0024C47278|nr:tripartite motif-containing protein 75-like isoform X2 [Hyla sarda]